MLRRSATKKSDSKVKSEEVEEVNEVSEEDRLKQLDDTLKDLLKDEE